MRIIAGKYKNRLLIGPKNIRPTQDIVKKSLFDILGDMSGVSFLDLYAGSGAIGIEALSRGSEKTYLVESNRGCISDIGTNLEKLNIGQECRVIELDAVEAIKKLHAKSEKFDIIFLDPPYYGDLAKKALQTIGAYDILAPCGWIIVQHYKKDPVCLEEGSFSVFRKTKYGDTFLSFYKRAES